MRGTWPPPPHTQHTTQYNQPGTTRAVPGLTAPKTQHSSRLAPTAQNHCEWYLPNSNTNMPTTWPPPKRTQHTTQHHQQGSTCAVPGHTAPIAQHCSGTWPHRSEPLHLVPGQHQANHQHAQTPPCPHTMTTIMHTILSNAFCRTDPNIVSP